MKPGPGPGPWPSSGAKSQNFQYGKNPESFKKKRENPGDFEPNNFLYQPNLSLQTKRITNTSNAYDITSLLIPVWMQWANQHFP